MVTLYEDGLRKVVQGVTSMEELLRVTQDQSEGESAGKAADMATPAVAKPVGLEPGYMPHFSCRAIGRDGKSLNGVIEADGLELASRQLRGQDSPCSSWRPVARLTRAQPGSGQPPGAPGYPVHDQ